MTGRSLQDIQEERRRQREGLTGRGLVGCLVFMLSLGAAYALFLWISDNHSIRYLFKVPRDTLPDPYLDILAVVDEKSKELEQRLDDIMYQVMWENDFKPIISLKIFSYDKYTRALQEGYSFYNHVNSEGIRIWE